MKPSSNTLMGSVLPPGRIGSQTKNKYSSSFFWEAALKKENTEASRQVDANFQQFSTPAYIVWNVCTLRDSC